MRSARGTFSGGYFLEEFGHSELTTEREKSVLNINMETEKDKLISEGYLSKGKRNQRYF
jgi:hypothetical protein